MRPIPRRRRIVAEYRSGFVTLVGRPNAGKSTLLNRILGQKVSIVSDKPQTTRTQVRGVLTRPDAQLVFVDTPGIHKPRTALGSSLNATAAAAASEVDVVCLVLDATAPYGRGDAFVADTLPPQSVVVVTKTDLATPEQIAAQLVATAHLEAAEWFPVSGRTGDGIEALVEYLCARMPEGPQLYPDDMVTDVPDAFWVAELVREQLLRVTRDELPHSIATRVTEWEWPRIRVEILVERESQKGIVIGKGGDNLRKVGTAVRRELGDDVYLELFVKVEKNWQRRPDTVERLGY
ncbi:MAG: GTPase Era [Actinobacteria bacterium]|nr:GTPase Era [Actinomycetota bacterium]NIS36031.1 GTPase Era [Actinomycetota bacterium]NIT98499.1 GTPase Era [Actinomycetota bacterium]NIU22104.1 GTPase Era [Actinomycetota bacterium]NIU70610.1 GTPase Era [Actinomycetota bacterium]